MSRRYDVLSIIVLAFILPRCNSNRSPASYLGQNLAGSTPELFAPNLVNTDSIEINAVFNTSFTEMFFTRIINESFVLHHAELRDGQWTAPQPMKMFADQEATAVAIDPSVTPDGQTLYFLGISPTDRTNHAAPDIYVSKKIDNQWQLAAKVGHPVSTDQYAESYPVVVADGSLYFESDRPGGFGKRDIYRAQYLGNGKFDTPINLGAEVNSEQNARSTYVSLDEKYLITANDYSQKTGFYISYKENNQWQTPIYLDLGDSLDNKWVHFCPYVSPDGQFFFFSRRFVDPPGSGWKGVTKGEVYWVDLSQVLKSGS